MHTTTPLPPDLQKFPGIATFLDHHADGASPHSRLAVFDCDGTIIRGDIGEAMFYRQIEHFHFRISPGLVWPDHPDASELDRLFRFLAALPPSARASTEEFTRFAAFLLDWYFGQLADGLVAKACTDIGRLFAGYTRREVAVLAGASLTEELNAAAGQRMLGGRVVPRGARYLRQPVNLLRLLARRGFTIFVVSGSSKWSVEPVFAPLGVPATNVIGIDMQEEKGILTAHEVQPVPIHDQKVAALRIRAEHPPVVVATDSPIDVPLLDAATDLRVLVHSQPGDPREWFRKAHRSPDSSWVVMDDLTEITPEEVLAHA